MGEPRLRLTHWLLIIIVVELFIGLIWGFDLGAR